MSNKEHQKLSNLLASIRDTWYSLICIRDDMKRAQLDICTPLEMTVQEALKYTAIKNRYRHDAEVAFRKSLVAERVLNKLLKKLRQYKLPLGVWIKHEDNMFMENTTYVRCYRKFTMKRCRLNDTHTYQLYIVETSQ